MKGSVLLWPEQGIGDEILFASMIPDMYKACDRLIVQADKRLLPLFSRSFPKDIEYRERDEIIPENDYDYHIPMGSAPQFFRLSADSFKPSSKGYLKEDTAKAREFRLKLLDKKFDHLIGLSWHSTAKRSLAKQKNISLEEIAIATYSPKNRLINLQYGRVDDEINNLARVNGIEIYDNKELDLYNDLDGLAALICACDEVVCIDNVTVNLAGALGKPTKLLLPFSSDWRWGCTGNQCDWYESIVIYRQKEIGNWQDILAKI